MCFSNLQFYTLKIMKIAKFYNRKDKYNIKDKSLMLNYINDKFMLTKSLYFDFLKTSKNHEF